MNDDVILEKIEDALHKVLEVESLDVDIRDDINLVGGISFGNLGLSSIDYVEFIILMEDEFNIVFDFDVRINSISEMVDYIKNEKENYSAEIF